MPLAALGKTPGLFTPARGTKAHASIPHTVHGRAQTRPRQKTYRRQFRQRQSACRSCAGGSPNVSQDEIDALFA